MLSKDVRKCEFGKLSCPGNDGQQCPGRNAELADENPFCACGYLGTLCSVCEDNYMRTWSGVPECVRCDESEVHKPLMLLGGFLALFCVVGVCVFKVDRLRAGAQKLYEIGAIKWRCAFFTGQVISAFSAISSKTGEKITYPQPAGTVAAALGISNLDIFSFVSLRCMVPRTTFYTVLVMKTIGPFCVIALLFCFPLACYSARRPYRGAWHTSARLSLLCLEIVLPSVTTTVMETLVCDEFDDGFFLRSQLSIACDGSPNRTTWVLYACLMMLVYPVGK